MHKMKKIYIFSHVINKNLFNNLMSLSCYLTKTEDRFDEGLLLYEEEIKSINLFLEVHSLYNDLVNISFMSSIINDKMIKKYIK
jgi:hypothetical protein